MRAEVDAHARAERADEGERVRDREQEITVDHAVQMLARQAENEVRERIPKRVAQMVAEFVRGRRLRSSALLGSERSIVLEEIKAFIKARLDAEAEVHARRSLPFTEERRDLVIEQILGAVGILISQMHTSPPAPPELAEPSRQEARTRARELARDAAIALWVRMSLPALPTGGGISVTINGPNYGTVAGVIGQINITSDAGRELREKLQELLEITQDVGDRADEARLLLAELAKASQRPDPPRGMVRAARDRLLALLSGAAKFDRAVHLLSHLPELIDLVTSQSGTVIS